jgi:hypothetical protein
MTQISKESQMTKVIKAVAASYIKMIHYKTQIKMRIVVKA